MKRFNLILKAFVDVAPKGSQVVLVVLAFLCLVCLLTAFTFLFYEIAHVWVPVSFAVLFTALIVWLWMRSQKEIDSPPFVPAHMVAKHGDTELGLTVDSRSIANRDLLADLEALLSMVRHRRPLPKPDGIVDATGAPIPKSQDTADERIKTVNEQVTAIANAIMAGVESLASAQSIGSTESVGANALESTSTIRGSAKERATE